MKRITSLLFAASLACSLQPVAARHCPTTDFTTGAAIPEGAVHDWNLGATGARGWIYANRLSTRDARQILITKVDKGSPADGVMQVGDVVLGIAGKRFDSDARVAFAKALTRAEAGDGKLELLCWRKGRELALTVPMQVFGAYSATTPFDCQKSKAIFQQGCEALAKRIETGKNLGNPITRSLNALALLASGKPEYMPLLKREAEWAQEFQGGNMLVWHYGYVIMFLAEYVSKTGDAAAMAGLQRMALEAAEGQSDVGSWGHAFAEADGRLGGYGMMNAPGVPLTIGLVMAREVGVESPMLDLAIERSTKLIRFYEDKGSVPYGDHVPWTKTHDDNGKNSMAAVLFERLDETPRSKYFSSMSLASHNEEREMGHTGNFWNLSWAMPAIAQLGPQATGAWMEEFGAWYFDLARRWDGTFRHQGPPQEKLDSTGKWDSTGAYLLAYAMPLKQLMLTGGKPGSLKPLSASEASSVVALGRGWSNAAPHTHYDRMEPELLLKGLGSWSPTVRERCAIALQRRGNIPLDSLIAMLDAKSVEERTGACLALGMRGQDAAPAVPGLVRALGSEDLWLRVNAAEALVKIGEPARVAIPKLLERISEGPTEEDPRAMEQRMLCLSVFGKLLSSSIDGVDRDLLRRAMVAGLKNQDGWARGMVGKIYPLLSYEEIKPILPEIYEAIITPAPSGIMFADQVRIAGLEALAKHHIREGIRPSIQMMDLQRWGKGRRISQLLDVIESYGVAAKPLEPDLRTLAADLRVHPESKGLTVHAERAQALAEKLSASNESSELRSLKSL